eukprot:1873945-Rhodomonas_salina.1
MLEGRRFSSPPSRVFNAGIQSLQLLAVDLEHLDLEQQTAIGRNAPCREAALAVSLISGDIELPHLSQRHTQASLRQQSSHNPTLPLNESTEPPVRSQGRNNRPSPDPSR